jgi:hypothetical protein
MNHLRARASTAGTHVALSPQPDRRVKAITRALGLIILITTKPWRKWVTPYVTSYFVKQDGMSNSSLWKKSWVQLVKTGFKRRPQHGCAPPWLKNNTLTKATVWSDPSGCATKLDSRAKWCPWKRKHTRMHWLGFENATCEKSSNVWVTGSIGGR